MTDRPGGLADLSDLELLDEHRLGDVDAFGELVRRHRDRLWAVALRTLGDPEEAADALQDALVSALRASSGSGGKRSSAAFRGESAVTTWLHRIVVNACIDRTRRRAVRPTDPLPPADLPDARPDAMAGVDTSLEVSAALAQLPEEQRTALVLVDMYGWSVDAAAEVLGCAVGTVKSRCARGRARLLPLLRERADGVGGSDGLSGNQEAAATVPPSTDTPHSHRESAPYEPGGGVSQDVQSPRP